MQIKVNLYFADIMVFYFAEYYFCNG